MDDRDEAPTTLLRFDLDGHDAARWSARSPQFMAELRRIVGARSIVTAAPAIGQLLYRLPPRGVDTVGAQRKAAGEQQLEIAERIIERYREREAEVVAGMAGRRRGAIASEGASEQPSQLQTTLRSRRAFLANAGRDRDLVVDGGLLGSFTG